MIISFSTFSHAFHRWQIWVLQAVVMVALASCVTPEHSSGAVVPNVQGVYQGSYTYGTAYPKLAGQATTFEINLHQMRGSDKIRGFIKEPYTDFGTPKHGFIWADVVGTCTSEDGVTHLKFRKTYRHFKQPSVSYQGSLPPGSSLLSGTWYITDKPSDSGMFQIERMHAQ